MSATNLTTISTIPLENSGPSILYLESNYEGNESYSFPGNFGNLTNDTLLGNMTNATEFPGYENEHVLVWWQQMIWIILFGSMVVVATGGNLIVIWIVLSDRRMRSVTNIFLVNLSVADAMVSSMNVLFTFIYMMSGHWPFGWLYCKISQFVAVLSISASVFTLMAISFDRYIAIVDPLRPRLKVRTTLCIVIWIWIASAIVAAPNFLFYTTELVPLKDGGLWVVCYSIWPDGNQTESQIEYIHSVVIMVLTYVLPMVSMSFTYTRMGYILWISKGPGETNISLENTRRSKRKVVKMMIVVVTIFGLCWLPFHLYFILATQYPFINELPYTQNIFLGIYWLAMSNSMYNPMIYCWLNGRFRNGFKKVFSKWLPCLKCLNEVNTTRRNQTANATMFSTSGSPETHIRVHGSEDLKSLKASIGQPNKRQQTVHSSYNPSSPFNTNNSNASSRSTVTTRSNASHVVCGELSNNKIISSTNGLEPSKGQTESATTSL